MNIITYCVRSIAPLDADDFACPRLWRGYVALVSKLSYFYTDTALNFKTEQEYLWDLTHRATPVGWEVVHDVIVERYCTGATQTGRACAF
jgi:hypothetical protein